MTSLRRDEGSPPKYLRDNVSTNTCTCQKPGRMAAALILVSGVSTDSYTSVYLGCFREVYDLFGRECTACHEYTITGEISLWRSFSRAFLFLFMHSFLLAKLLRENLRLLDFHPGAGMLPSLTVTCLPDCPPLSHRRMREPACLLELCAVCSLQNRAQTSSSTQLLS